MTTRRTMLKTTLAAAGAATLPAIASAEPYKPTGHVKHSACFWCFNAAGEKWDAETMCLIAKELGLLSVEIIEPEHWPTLKKHGLTCAIAGNGYAKPGFIYGLNNPRHNAGVVESTKKRIDECAAFGCPNVIAFNGYKWVNPEDPKSGEISADDGAKECIKVLKDLALYAEKKGVTVCMEHLNTRDGSHPMKGHPGYQGDDLDYVAGIIRAVGSPRIKLLFDVYHVQIMHGDILRRIEQTKDIIGHVHTAGNPGRGELDEAQEINYPAVVRKLLAIKYAGHVGHEFIPTRNPREGLAQAVKVCDA